MKKIDIKVAESLEEGKTYHVLLGPDNHIPTKIELNDLHDFLSTKYPKFKWLVTPFYIKIGDKSEYSKAKVLEVIEKYFECGKNKEVSYYPFHCNSCRIKEELKKELGLE